ncbi:MAG: hypothetical protein K0Q72_3930, partial [Armatimonadetes bacterium]|nr:hypothetical protein [Armatimonadota bacterium]
PPPVASTGIAPPTVSAAPAVYDPAVVTIRPKPGQAAPAPQRLVQAPTTPHPSVYQNPAVRRQTSQAVVQSFPTVPDAAFSAASAPVPQPSATSAIVMVRNTAAMPVELSIDGPEQLTAVVAPGSALPVNLPPGTYQLRASGDGIRSRRSTLALAANRSYALIIDRRQDSGRDSLVLIEPAVDGQGG